MLMIGFPLLLLPLAICNIIVFLMPDVSLVATLATITLPSGASWPITLSDVLVTLALVLLLLEVMKGARPGTKFMTDHLLALIVFGAAAAEFVMLPRFGNSTFFFLTLIALVDFISGVALRVRRGRRMVMVPADTLVQPPAVKAPPQPAAKPAPVAQPAPPAPVPVAAAPTAAPAPAATPVVAAEPARAEPAPVIPPASPAAPVASSSATSTSTDGSPSALALALTRANEHGASTAADDAPRKTDLK